MQKVISIQNEIQNCIMFSKHVQLSFISGTHTHAHAHAHAHTHTHTHTHSPASLLGTPVQLLCNTNCYSANHMTTVYPSSDGYFQQDNASCHKAQIISDWFLEHDNEFTLLKWPLQSPDLNPIEHHWDVVEREIRIMCSRQICSNCMMLSCQYGPKSLRDVSNTLLNLYHEELRQFLRQKGFKPGTSKVYLIKWTVSECVCMCVYIYILSCCSKTPKCKPRGRFLV